MVKRLQKHKSLILILVIFGTVFSLISLVNHYFLRTYSLDLGLYTNALYDYIRFQWNDSTVCQEIGMNNLADHFDLYLIFFSPLSLIFGTYTLLVVQIVAILFGGTGIYAYFNLSEKTKNVAIYAMLYFFLFYGLYGATAFDYHSNVVATCFVPWFFYFLKKIELVKSSLVLLLIFVAKENMSLWTIFICLGLALEYWKTKPTRNYLLGCVGFSALYFVLITSVVIPSINNIGYTHFEYSFLGGSPSEAIWQLLSHPIDSFQVLFTNHINNPEGDFVKAELHLMLLASGLPFLLWKPQYLVMLVPIYFQKLYHDNINMWSIANQYSIEFAPILAIGIFKAIANFKSVKWKKTTSIALLVLTASATFKSMDAPVFYTDRARIRFYQAKHYQKSYNVAAVKKALSEIPENAIVSAQSPLLPQMALRDNIYNFPIVKDAAFIVVCEQDKSFPLTNEELVSLVSTYKSSPKWEIVYDQDVTILKRIN